MDKEKFTKIWIYYSGILEIFLGALMLFWMSPIMTALGAEHVPFWNHLAGITIIFMGIILIYAGTDVEKFVFIPAVSSFYRIAVVMANIYSFITLQATIPILANIIGIASFYDGGSAIFTLWLLWDLGYLKKK